MEWRTKTPIQMINIKTDKFSGTPVQEKKIKRKKE